MRHFLTTADWSRAELQALLDDAAAYKRDASPRSDGRAGEAAAPTAALAGKAVALVFFNPSLRTRTSFQVGAARLGAQAVVLEPGQSSWPIEAVEGVVMDSEAEEHAKEAARVLSRYADLIAVRAFPKFQNWAVEREDPILSAFARYADVPVINMETIVHPCQELALMLTLQERFADRGAGATDAKTFLLTWVPHPKPLNTAVANSAVMIAAKFGFDVRVLAPHPAYRLDDRYMEAARADAAAQGRSVTVLDDIEAAYDGADVVYLKSWGALPFIGRRAEEQALRASLDVARFRVDAEKMARTNNAVVSHCLPMRRNVKMADAVADSPAFAGIDEAENRLYVQMAVMAELARHAGDGEPTL